MKFEDYLMQPGDDKQKRLDLQEEVENLQAELDEEQAINKALHSVLHSPVSSHPCLAPFLPPEVQSLLAELATVENEIIWLEKKVNELKLSLHQERTQTKESKLRKRQCRKLREQYHLSPHSTGNQSVLNEDLYQLSRSRQYEEFRKEKTKFRRASVGSAAEMLSMLFPSPTKVEKSRRHTGRTQKEYHISREICIKKPNELSEELIRCLIAIFLDLNQAAQDKEVSAIVSKRSLSCMNTKGSKPSFSCKASMIPFNHNVSNLDPYGIMPDLDSAIRDIGPYKNFIQITRDSLDISQFWDSLPMAGKLRVLLYRLSSVDLTFLTYKQKLAFWINIYNACIMHAFLEHGLPSSQEKLLTIMNKAALNVGGIVLNALAIEHFILRHPCESNQGPMEEKERLLRQAYGLGYPEPNVTFAICRGSRSSPALRVYTPDEVVNEVEQAKVEYLEASVGITNKRKIVVPKLLQWNMRDFADDMESLLEWIYSQLPHSVSLKRLMMECLNGETNSTSRKIVEIQPYDSEFRYLLPL